MLKRYSIAEARDKFAALIHQVEEDAAVEVTRRGKPVAVLLSIEEYQRLQKGQTGFWEAFSAYRSKFDLQGLNIEPEIFAEGRDAAPGREVLL